LAGMIIPRVATERGVGIIGLSSNLVCRRMGQWASGCFANELRVLYAQEVFA
jgi:hypothetical protein